MVPLRRSRWNDVIDVLADRSIEQGAPEHIGSYYRPEFVTEAVREWLVGLGVHTLDIDAESPWENGNIESFNAHLRYELLNGNISDSLEEAQIVTGWWRDHDNRPGSQSSFGDPPPTEDRSGCRPGRSIPRHSPPPPLRPGWHWKAHID